MGILSPIKFFLVLAIVLYVSTNYAAARRAGGGGSRSSSSRSSGSRSSSSRSSSSRSSSSRSSSWGRSSSSGSRSSWGSSSRSSSPSSSRSSWFSRSSSPSSSTRYGSSSPSGSSSSPSSPSSSWWRRSPSPSPSSSPSRYSGPTKYGGASSSSATNRNWYAGSSGSYGGTAAAPISRPNYGISGRNTPSVRAPSAVASQPSKVVYSTTYNNFNTRHVSGSQYGGNGFGGSGLGGAGSSTVWGSSGKSGYGKGTLVATGATSAVGGYALGRMMGSSSSRSSTTYNTYYGGGSNYYGGYYPGYYGGCWGGCCWGGCYHYTTYVPYRSRYQEYYPTEAPSTTAPVYIGGDAVVPTTTQAPKTVDLCMLARWNRELAFAELPNMALDFLVNNNVSGNTTDDKARFMYDFFTVSVDAYDQYNSSADIFEIPAAFDKTTCNIKVSKTSLVNFAGTTQAEEPVMTSLRHMISLYTNKSASQEALRQVVDAANSCLPQGPNVTSPEVLSCIDFSLSPEQMLKLEVPHSMFGSSEICRRQLSTDVFKCLPKAKDSLCRMEHLGALNLFARNFYLCTDAMDDATTSAPVVPTTSWSNFEYVTTPKSSWWSRLFG